MRLRRLLALAVVLIPATAAAQTQTQTLLPRPAIDDPGTAALQSTRDPPLGFPYNTGSYSSGDGGQAQVPLRDFLSSRQDQQRAEIIERIESQGIWLQRLLDERDRQYAQRFVAQQAAVEAALASAKEAVLKAENAANDRFDSVNEFRATLTDQANNFVSKSTAEARFAALEEKVNSVYDRLNAMQSQGQGRTDAWDLVLIIGSLAIAAISLMYTAMNRQRQPLRDGDKNG